MCKPQNQATYRQYSGECMLRGFFRYAEKCDCELMKRGERQDEDWKGTGRDVILGAAECQRKKWMGGNEPFPVFGLYRIPEGRWGRFSNFPLFDCRWISNFLSYNKHTRVTFLPFPLKRIIHCDCGILSMIFCIKNSCSFQKLLKSLQWIDCSGHGIYQQECQLYLES